MTTVQPIALASLLLASTAFAQSAPPTIGEAFPALGSELRWHRGAPRQSLEPGRVYLIDFWATWCPPCYPMLEELSQLQDRYQEGGLVVIGLAIGTDAGTPLADFLDREDARVRYAIAEPIDEDALKRRLVHALYAEPESFPIPLLLLVGRDGRLAWVSDLQGPEPDLDAVVTAALDDSLDVAGAAAAASARLEATRRAGPAFEEVAALTREGRWRQALARMIDPASQQPETYGSAATALLERLLCRGETAAASNYGERLLAGPLRHRASDLVSAARAILYAPRASATGSGPGLLPKAWWCARSHWRGDAEASARWQVRAVETARAQGWSADHVDVFGWPLEYVMRSQARQFIERCGASDR